MEFSRVSFMFTDEQMETIKQAINTINQTIAPTRVSLTPKSRLKLVKMGDGSHPFTEHAFRHATVNPEFMPNYSTVEEFQKDWTLTMQLKEIKNAVNLLNRDVEDTYMAAGADAFIHAREYYNTSQRAAKNNIPGAQTIVDDLKPRWLKRFPDNEGGEEEQNPAEPIAAISGPTGGK
jgi:hypothetical protein